jgi:3D-(3,5/4)-trihydroxycyclohexane-1,2-dione acylhydrolase (decyclizing)
MTTTAGSTEREALARAREERARAIARAGSLDAALASGALAQRIDTTLSEALVLGLLRQGVRSFLCVLGHGSTEIGEVLRIYQELGLLRTCGVRSEVSAAHAATALRWVTGEKAAVVTSIGPGALHALAGSLAAASDGIGVWHLYGDETTEDEGPNMPEAIGAALRRGLNTVDHPHRGGPFYLLLPLNTQPAALADFNLDELPSGAPPALGAAADDGSYARAAEALLAAERVVVKVGGGARAAGSELAELLDLCDGVAVTSPLVSGVLAYHHPRNMSVGGSKGSISGNFAMEQADLLVALGTRFVCQSDCSRTGYPRVQKVVNLNVDHHAATHYGRTIALLGDAAATLGLLSRELRRQGAEPRETESAWLASCREQRRRWDAFKAERYAKPCLPDPIWGGEVLTQPAAIKIATDWARECDAVTFFDAGDVQANGFQIAEDDRLGRTFTETGASYMGFAVSALLATGLAREGFYGLALSGDGSFTMNPQILIDGVAHGARGCILLLDNRRMAAISALQQAQYGSDHATSDGVAVDYAAWARAVEGVAAFEGGRSPESLREALEKARTHQGLSLVHLPVYYGPDPLGGLGAFGRWNVGNWAEETQSLRHRIGL